MIGVILLVAFMVLMFPVGFFLTGAVVAGVHGWLLTDDAEDRHKDSELLPLSRT
jgi:hypothetical protein